MKLVTHIVIAWFAAGLSGILCGLSLHPDRGFEPSLALLMAAVALAITAAALILRGLDG
jgi:hypothetical protein